ncbi:hypothetical protein [Methylibium sp.]|uniref:hypothetical protein n=1 Tax=Methylibium sp. TaxID=2067992 RepID=UPI003F720FEC
MSRRTARRQRFYARMRLARSCAAWSWVGAVDMTNLIPLGAIEALVTRMRSWPRVPESTIQEPDPLF